MYSLNKIIFEIWENDKTKIMYQNFALTTLKTAAVNFLFADNTNYESIWSLLCLQAICHHW